MAKRHSKWQRQLIKIIKADLAEAIMVEIHADEQRILYGDGSAEPEGILNLEDLVDIGPEVTKLVRIDLYKELETRKGDIPNDVRDNSD